MYKKVLFIVLILFVAFFVVRQSYAASLSGLSDTITTSRPSASAPLNTDQTAGEGQATIVDNNAVYLASDSATLYADPAGGGETTNTGLNVASMSAQIAGSPNTRIVYFTNTAANNHHKGDALVVPITAMHTVTFKPQATIPSGGHIIISFPSLASTDSNPASPSASGFQFNGLDNTLVKFNNATCSSISISGTGAGQTPNIDCTTSGTVTGGGATTVTVLIGCSVNSGANCTTQVPRLINPMRKATDSQRGQGATTTNSDNWKVNVFTQDNSSITLDTGTAAVGIIESVFVQANIDPTLTFTIIGEPSGTTINNAFVTGCPNSSSDVTNTGIPTTATDVNMGSVTTSVLIAAQKLTVSTNALGGYVLTATSSGQLQDPQNGYKVNSTVNPAAIVAGVENFGIHPCGQDVTNATTTWNNGGNASQFSLSASSPNNGFIGWPLQDGANSVQLANHSGTANLISTAVEYAITASATTPAGLYTSVITYVATPTFN